MTGNGLEMYVLTLRMGCVTVEGYFISWRLHGLIYKTEKRLSTPNVGLRLTHRQMSTQPSARQRAEAQHMISALVQSSHACCYLPPPVKPHVDCKAGS